MKTHFIFLLLTCLGSLSDAGLAAQHDSFLASEAKMKDFKENIKRSVFELRTFIRVIVNNELKQKLREGAIEKAIEIFEGENNIVQVSSKYRPTKKYKIRRYLWHLLRLESKYTTVDIEWYDVHFISEIKRDSDGNYRATVRVIQKFKGFGPDGQIKYKDTTIKDVDITIQVHKQHYGRESKEIFDVKLGDIGVHETI